MWLLQVQKSLGFSLFQGCCSVFDLCSSVRPCEWPRCACGSAAVRWSDMKHILLCLYLPRYQCVSSAAKYVRTTWSPWRPRCRWRSYLAQGGSLKSLDQSTGASGASLRVFERWALLCWSVLNLTAPKKDERPWNFKSSETSKVPPRDWICSKEKLCFETACET